MINLRLKAKIVERFGTQADFAQRIATDETIVSRVIRCRRILDADAQRRWADTLGCKPQEVFDRVDCAEP